MVVFGHLSAPSNHGLDRRLYGLSGVRIVPGGLWVVLELEWSPRTPPVEFYRNRSTSHQPHPLLFLFLSLCGSPISILPFFLASAAASFSPISFFPFFLASFFSPSPSFPSSWLLLLAPSPSFPSSLQRLFSWFRRQMSCLFFFCISGVMNVSLSCCNMIAWQQASLCNVEHLFCAFNKIVVF